MAPPWAGPSILPSLFRGGWGNITSCDLDCLDRLPVTLKNVARKAS